MKTKYLWKRYWTLPDGKISLTDNGFLEDPSGSFGKYANPDLVSIDILGEIGCLVLLGEPGLGKSTEIADLYENTSKKVGADHVKWMNLSNIMSPDSFIEQLTQDSSYKNWAENNEPLFLFLDSFDEGVFSFKSFANYLSDLLAKNRDKIPNLHLRISCRTALWPTYLESSLLDLWGEPAYKKYELCPLTKADVKSASDSNGINKEEFLTELHNKGVIGLAGKPLTLTFLMDMYKKDGHLPDKKEEIYSHGCELLIQEPDPSKKNGATKPILTLIQKNSIAERIAMATIIGGKPTISLEGELLAGEIALSELHGIEIIGDTAISIGDEQILEVLNSGLFSSRGNGKMGWAHQTYGEFLAARYMARHKLAWKQIQSFLFQDPLKIGSFQVVPQLYEVSAWFASLDQGFFDNAVLLDPEFLLLSDANVITDSQRKALAEQLLTRLDSGELLDRWETFNATNYKKLNHPDLSAQLEPYIKDSTRGIVVRRATMEIASACLTTPLEEILVAIALNVDEDVSIRVRAILAISNMGSAKARESLKPIIKLGFEKDPEDELKGVVLRALWPSHITTPEVFSLITASKRSSLWGTYHHFIEAELASSLRPEDVVSGLNWIDQNDAKARDTEYSFRKLSDSIMMKAWTHISTPQVLEKFAKISYNRLERFEEIVGERALHEEIATEFQAALESQEENRKKLIKQLVLIALEKDTSRNKGLILLPHGKIRLIFQKDISWLIEWLLSEENIEIQKMLAEVIGRVFDTKDAKIIDLIFHAREKNTFLADETSFWFTTVDLSSESAKTQREQWEQQQKWQTQRERDEKEEILKVIPVKKIVEFLEKAEAGEMDYWWRLNNALCMYQHELDDDDIRELPGWKVIGEDIQKRIIECGKKFLDVQESKPEIWLGKKITYFPAVAGYRAMKIFYEQERDFMVKKGAEFWKKWGPITLGLPLVSNDPKNGELIALAYKHSPDEIISTLDVLIDDEAQQHDGIFINDLLVDCLDERMSAFLLVKAKKPGFSPKAANEIVRFLLSHDVKEAKVYVKEKIKIPLSSTSEEKKEVLSAAASLLWNANFEDWTFLWDLIAKDNDFGRGLVETAHDTPLRGSTVLLEMTEKQLADLYIWLTKEFSPEEYSRPEGAGTVTPQISIGDWRDSVLRNLMDRGTIESCKQVERVALTLPQYKWIKEFSLVEAKRVALLKSWQPPKIDQIFKLVENHDLRLVNTPDELMNIVLESLQKLEAKLQRNEHPQVVNLWNDKQERGKPLVSWPKDENHLSDTIKVHLVEDLQSSGVIIGREVEINSTSKTDIHISVFTKDRLGRPVEPITVTIEAKGCWHPDLETAMESQLVGKYLSAEGCHHGIYLIGWFNCDKWNDPKDSRHKKTSKLSLEQAQDKFAKQAQELSSKTSFRVNSIVLDTRLR